jgi:proteasome lid subunit RPN8/RPN11
VADTDYSPLAARLAAVAEADPGREVCGFVVEDAAGRLELLPVRNVAGEVRGAPGLPGDARRAFLADPSAHLALSRRLRVEGGRIAAVYHSHVDAPAVLSTVDLEQAVWGGEPLHPGVDQVIIGTMGGKVLEIRVFLWFEGSFRATVIPLGG